MATRSVAMQKQVRARRCHGDGGSAIVEFVFMSVLLVFLLFGVLQVAAVFFVRSVASSAAADGARYGSNANAEPSDGAVRATSLIATGLGDGMARQLPCTAELTADPPTGLAMTQVHCSGRIRSIFLPLAAFVDIDVTGSSLEEHP
jgi:Flp pilus assembly protein TadG